MNTDLNSSTRAAQAERTLGLTELGLVVCLVWSAELGLGGLWALWQGDAAPTPLWIVMAAVATGVWTVGVIAAVLRLRLGAVWEPLALVGGRRGATVMTLALSCGFVGAVGAMALQYFFSTGDSQMARLVSTTDGLLAVSVVALLLPVVEELYYRGLLFGALRAHVPPWAAIGAVTVWFAGVHAWQVAGDWIALPVIGVMGLLWTLMRHYTGSIWPGLISHLLYNGLVVAAAWVSRFAGSAGG